MPNDPYQILGVSHNASEDDIKQAYRRLAKQYHPDLHPGDAVAAQKMNEINQAYDMLKNPAAYQQQQHYARQQQSSQTYHTTYYDPFGFWGSTGDQSSSQYQAQDDPFGFGFGFGANEQEQEQQYQWNYRRRRRGGLLWKLFVAYLVLNLMYALFSSCSYRNYSAYPYSDYYGYYGYSEPYDNSAQSGVHSARPGGAYGG